MKETRRSGDEKIYLNCVGMVNCLGSTPGEIYDRLMQADRSGFVRDTGSVPGQALYKGEYRGELPSLPREHAAYECRNNQLILAALLQIEGHIRAAVETYGAARVGVVVGSSTSGIREGEEAVMELRRSGAFPSSFHLEKQGMGFPAEFIHAYLGLGGPAYTISTACTSSAVAMVSARALLRSGQCHAVITGGSDALCRLTLNGFFSLDSLSRSVCNPMSRDRDGITIGEGCALFLMTREGPGIRFMGAGSSSDAYHISAPEPDGQGAEIAMRAALQDASVEPSEVIYVNLHGTATLQNDAMESKAVSRVFGTDTACSSTKAFTGHTLGAAGATEAAICWMLLDRADGEICLPPQGGDGQPDETLPCLRLTGERHHVPFQASRYILSNSFAFGGNNCSILLGKDPRPEGRPRCFAVRDVVPHGDSMLLLHSITAYSEQHAESLASIDANNPFFDATRRAVPVWIGYEYMAQTMAAYSGIKARLQSIPVRPGFFLGNRSAVCHVPFFEEGWRLRTMVVCQWETGELGSFECRIEDAASGRCLMEAEVSAYLPPDLSAVRRRLHAS